MADLDTIPLTLVGHPFAPIGMGEQLRSHIAACARVHLDFGVLDIFRAAQRTDAAHFAAVGERERRRAPAGIRVFHINGDEIDNVLAALAASGDDFDAGYNIVVPAWELPSYPKAWAERLARFDEVWAISRFVQDSLATAGLRSHLIGQAVEPSPGPLLPRRAFGIRESAFVLLHFFDLSSYASRKNPDAVMQLFRQLRAKRPFLDAQLVLKVKNVESAAAEWAARFRGDPHVLVIDTPLDTAGVRGLYGACDCFVSLHRAEGFGRGLGEAMALGKVAMGTGWSGNLDFMSEQNSLLVKSRQVRVPRDAYPHWNGQSWAEPDVDHALALLRPVLDDPARGRAIAARGQRDVLRGWSHRAVGLRVLERLEAIAAGAEKLRGMSAPQADAAAPARRRRATA